MRAALLPPTRRAIAGVVVLLVTVGLIGIVVSQRPPAQAQEKTTTTSAASICCSNSNAKTFYVQINCGTVAVCTGGFIPQNLTIPVGSNVTWTSRENPAYYIYHRVVFQQGGWESQQLNGEDTYTANFPSPGVFQYYDGDFAGNNGTIIVVPSNSTGG